jgi:hypothetical protein
MYMLKSTGSSRYLVIVAVVLSPLAAACSGTDSVSDTTTTTSDRPEAAAESNETSSSNNTYEEATIASDSVTEEDLDRFLAATEAALVDTSAEGLILEAPEIYIAIAQGSCARFTQGDSLGQIVNDHLNDTDTTPAADDEQLIGALLGAAVQTICREHVAKV